MRLYISWFCLSHDCGVRVGSRSRVFLGKMGIEVDCFIYAEAGLALLHVLELVSDSYFSLATLTPILSKLL